MGAMPEPVARVVMEAEQDHALDMLAICVLRKCELLGQQGGLGPWGPGCWTTARPLRACSSPTWDPPHHGTDTWKGLWWDLAPNKGLPCPQEAQSQAQRCHTRGRGPQGFHSASGGSQTLWAWKEVGFSGQRVCSFYWIHTGRHPESQRPRGDWHGIMVALVFWGSLDLWASLRRRAGPPVTLTCSDTEQAG